MRSESRNTLRSGVSQAQSFRWSTFYPILILVIFLGVAFDNMDQVTCSFILPMMKMEWNLDYVQASYMPAFSLLGTCIGAVLWGIMGDRIGRRKTLLFTILLFSLTNLIQTHSWSYLQFTVTCFVMGIGVGGEIPLAFTLLAEFLPARSRTRITIVLGVLALVVGYAFAAISAHFLLPIAGWKSLFYVQALPALLLIPIRFQIPESPRYLRASGQEEAALQAAAEVERRTGTYNPLRDSSEEGLIPPGKRLPLFESLRLLWHGMYLPRTICSWIFGFCIGFFQFGLIIWLPTTLIKSGYSDVQSINYPMLINFFALPSVLVIIYLLQKRSSKSILTLYPGVAGLLTILFGLFLAPVAAHPIVLVLLGGGIFFFGVTLLGIFPSYSAEIYPTEIRGSGSGWATGFTRIGSFLGPLVGGILFQFSIPPGAILIFFGVPLLLAAGVMQYWGVRTQNRTLEQISPSQ